METLSASVPGPGSTRRGALTALLLVLLAAVCLYARGHIKLPPAPPARPLDRAESQAQKPVPAKPGSQTKAVDTYPGAELDLAVARRYAPVFYQRLAGGEHPPRYDYITNFDFDGDWEGNNNWEHAADPRFPMRGYVYYAVVESETHYFITYATFHARDWSPLEPLIGSVLDQVQKSEKYGKYLPPELRRLIEVNHENDLEGAQVVIRKAAGSAGESVEAVETLAHNEFHRYLPPGSGLSAEIDPEHTLHFEEGRPALYIEAQKHGVHGHPYTPGHHQSSILDSPDGPLLVYRYKGRAEDPEKVRDNAGYDLLPLYSSFWEKARGLAKPNGAFGEVYDFGDFFCRELPRGVLARVTKNLCRLGSTGIAFRGDFAGKNKAFLPWGWNSPAETQLGPGEWFLHPVRMLQAHYPDAAFSENYASNPFLGIFRQSP